MQTSNCANLHDSIIKILVGAGRPITAWLFGPTPFTLSNAALSLGRPRDIVAHTALLFVELPLLVRHGTNVAIHCTYKFNSNRIAQVTDFDEKRRAAFLYPTSKDLHMKTTTARSVGSKAIHFLQALSFSKALECSKLSHQFYLSFSDHQVSSNDILRPPHSPPCRHHCTIRGSCNKMEDAGLSVQHPR